MARHGSYYVLDGGPLHGMGQAAQTAAPTSAQSSALAPVSTRGGGALMTVWSLAGTAASAALAYHGYKRNNSIGWALAWAVLGGLVWPAGLAIAFAQGFGKPRRVASNRRRRRARRRNR